MRSARQSATGRTRRRRAKHGPERHLRHALRHLDGRAARHGSTRAPAQRNAGDVPRAAGGGSRERCGRPRRRRRRQRLRFWSPRRRRGLPVAPLRPRLRPLGVAFVRTRVPGRHSGLRRRCRQHQQLRRRRCAVGDRVVAVPGELEPQPVPDQRGLRNGSTLDRHRLVDRPRDLSRHDHRPSGQLRAARPSCCRFWPRRTSAWRPPPRRRPSSPARRGRSA